MTQALAQMLRGLGPGGELGLTLTDGTQKTVVIDGIRATLTGLLDNPLQVYLPAVVTCPRRRHGYGLEQREILTPVHSTTG